MPLMQRKCRAVPLLPQGTVYGDKDDDTHARVIGTGIHHLRPTSKRVDRAVSLAKHKEPSRFPRMVQQFGRAPNDLSSVAAGVCRRRPSQPLPRPSYTTHPHITYARSIRDLHARARLGRKRKGEFSDRAYLGKNFL
jgi:hypothetical protein